MKEDGGKRRGGREKAGDSDREPREVVMATAMVVTMVVMRVARQTKWQRQASVSTAASAPASVGSMIPQVTNNRESNGSERDAPACAVPCRPGSFVRRDGMGWDVRGSGAALVSWDRRHGESGVEKRDVADFFALETLELEVQS